MGGESVNILTIPLGDGKFIIPEPKLEGGNCSELARGTPPHAPVDARLRGHDGAVLI